MIVFRPLKTSTYQQSPPPPKRPIVRSPSKKLPPPTYREVFAQAVTQTPEKAAPIPQRKHENIQPDVQQVQQSDAPRVTQSDAKHDVARDDGHSARVATLSAPSKHLPVRLKRSKTMAKQLFQNRGLADAYLPVALIQHSKRLQHQLEHLDLKTLAQDAEVRHKRDRFMAQLTRMQASHASIDKLPPIDANSSVLGGARLLTHESPRKAYKKNIKADKSIQEILGLLHESDARPIRSQSQHRLGIGAPPSDASFMHAKVPDVLQQSAIIAHASASAHQGFDSGVKRKSRIVRLQHRIRMKKDDYAFADFKSALFAPLPDEPGDKQAHYQYRQQQQQQHSDKQQLEMKIEKMFQQIQQVQAQLKASQAQRGTEGALKRQVDALDAQSKEIVDDWQRQSGAQVQDKDTN